MNPYVPDWMASTMWRPSFGDFACCLNPSPWGRSTTSTRSTVRPPWWGARHEAFDSLRRRGVGVGVPTGKTHP